MSKLLINDIKSNNSEVKSNNSEVKSNNSEVKSNNEEKQIEEMARIIQSTKKCDALCVSECISNKCEYPHYEGVTCLAEHQAEALYNADYRKQSEGENISQMHPSDEFICEKCGLIIRECCRYEIDEDDGDEICYEFPYRFCPRCGMKVKGGAEQ